jgi:hypothetical protein
MLKHGDTKGAAREGVIRIFLQDNLPKLVEIKSGEIVGADGTRSGQLDIVLQSIAAPRIPLFDNIQITLADAALGVFEIKSTLTTGSSRKTNHLASALSTFAKVKAISRNSNSFIDSQLRKGLSLTTTPCFLIAYSGPSLRALKEGLRGYSEYKRLPIDEFGPEVICVLDKDYCVFRNDGWIVPIDWVLAPKNKDVPDGYFLWSEQSGTGLMAIFLYVCRILEASATKSINLLDYL